MAMRTFRDTTGATWTVWDTVRSSDTPVTAALADGWLTFESASGKRRLAPIPHEWVAASESELSRLLQRVEAVAPARPDPPASSDPSDRPPPPAPRTETAPSLRTFTDGAGLSWSVWAVRPGTGPNAGQPVDRRRGLGLSAGAPSQAERRLQVRSEFSGGWLAFHAANGARRRLIPIPERWEALPDAELERRCREARPMPDVQR